jgi:hypothetical protein
MGTRAQMIKEVYEPKEKRLQKKNEAQRAHFKFGMDQNGKSTLDL